MKTIKEIKIECINILNKNNIEDSNSITNLIMQKVLNCNKQYLIINDKNNVSIEDEDLIKEYINKILDNTPVEYITNNKEFMNCTIYVNENVLIPRHDTEILVENIIDILTNKFNDKPNIKILDLCTGSSCISVGLLTYIKENNNELFNKINIVASDISKDALKVAKINVDNNNLSDKIELVHSNLFENIQGKFDFIVSNPPYIIKDEIEKLDANVKKEPILALDGGEDGLYFYNNISEIGKHYLKENGYILYEIGYNQGKDVKQILEKNNYNNIEIVKDLSKNDRVVIGIK